MALEHFYGSSLGNEFSVILEGKGNHQLDCLAALPGYIVS